MGEKMLEHLLQDLDYTLLKGHMNHKISAITNHTKNVSKDDLFVCMKGSRTNSHELLEEVYKSGCTCIVVSENVLMKDNVTYIYVNDSEQAWAIICKNFFKHSHIKLIGVTGTKGKTTVCHLLYDMLNKKYKTGMISSQGIDLMCHIETINTTPDAYIIHKYLKEMEEKGYEYCIIEVSSLAVYHKRIEGLEFEIGIFTNISEDHIGGYEHPDYNHYVCCKLEFLKKCHLVVVNGDMCIHIPKSEEKCEVVSFSVNQKSDLMATDIKSGANTMSFDVKGVINDHITIDKLGLFHVYNILPVLIVCEQMKVEYDKFIHIDILGRCEIVDSHRYRLVLIDYAHNVSSVSALLESIQYYDYEKIIVVYGAGGNRDKKRRYEIGKLISSYNAYSIVTMDNPRYEDVNKICEDIVKGIKENNGEYKVIVDRKEAIEYALTTATKRDVVLLLGKGNEHYQIIQDKKYEFNEREIVVNYLKKL